MQHYGTHRLETDRLILRKFVNEDVTAMYKNWASDEEVIKFLMWPPHLRVEISESVISDWVKLYSNDTFYQWAIVVKDNGNEPIGTISVVNMNEEIAMVHIGYCIGRI